MKIVICIPTYNEAANIGRLIDVLVKEEFPKIGKHVMQILVIDDRSPDGSGAVVRARMKKFPNVFLLEGEKQGLGAAYMRGFRYALEKLHAGAVMEMDADFQHDPADVKRFVAELDKGYDYIIGSRFIKGGSIPRDWEVKRRFLSVVSNIFIRAVLGLWEVHDITTGFRLARVKGCLERVDLRKLLSRSYAYKIHLLYEMRHLGGKIKEIPINFVKREKGWSKMESEDFTQSLKVVFTIRLRSLGFPI